MAHAPLQHNSSPWGDPLLTSFRTSSICLKGREIRALARTRICCTDTDLENGQFLFDTYASAVQTHPNSYALYLHTRASNQQPLLLQLLKWFIDEMDAWVLPQSSLSQKSLIYKPTTNETIFNFSLRGAFETLNRIETALLQASQSYPDQNKTSLGKHYTEAEKIAEKSGLIPPQV